MRGLRGVEEYRVLLLPDHATPIVVRTHTEEPVPFVIFDSRGKKETGANAYSEEIAGMDGITRIEKGHELMDLFIKGGR
jgi:2,3-bisphosphoglycerate-independent phosphoglycerate mutase